MSFRWRSGCEGLCTWFLALALFVGFLPTAGAAGTGIQTCRCDPNPAVPKDGGYVIYKPSKHGSTYKYPANYGQGACAAWDIERPPFCDGDSPPPWCWSQWRYVKVTACAGAGLGKSSMFTAANQLYWSYETCGNANTYTSSGAGLGLKNLTTTVHKHLVTTRVQVQAESGSMVRDSETCSHNDLCQRSSAEHWLWKLRVNIAQTASWLNRAITDAVTLSLTSCLLKAISDTFMRIAVVEGDMDGNRIGYLYAADQLTGSYTQWPDAEWCIKSDYDPRFRPWYATGATSPKDVVVVVDVSGSMHTNDRYKLAKAATKAILKTVSWRDFVNIILFNDKISAIFSPLLVSGTESNIEKMLTWIDEQVWARRGTNFGTALRKAFDVLAESIDKRQTSTCQKTILFLTDGEDPNFEDYTYVKDKATKYGAILFTYALGGQANKVVTKRLACENRGVFYPVGDTDNLARVMSSYYNYFVAGQRICTPNVVKYLEYVTKNYLYASCLPVYSNKTETSELLGVSCMDYSVIAKIEDLRKESDWDSFMCQVSDSSKKCMMLELTECTRQQLRAAVPGGESVCSAATAGGEDGTRECPCIDPDCEDTDGFVDELGWFCDQWVGDDCDDAPAWGLSPAGTAALKAQCRKTCGLCSYGRHFCSMPRTCPPVRAEQCRACLSEQVYGLDLEGEKMCCPGSCGAAPGGADADEGGGHLLAYVFAAVGALVLLVGIACVVRRLRRSRASAPAAPVPAPAVVVGVTATAVPAPRRPSSSYAVPGYWQGRDAHLKNTLLPLEDLIQDVQALVDATYKKVSTRDRRGIVPDGLRIVGVQRNENRELWNCYCEGRSTILKQRPAGSTPLTHMRGGAAKTMEHLQSTGNRLQAHVECDGRVNEVLLFHGTSPAAVEDIAKGGFRLDLAGSNAGTMFGRGVYFAECSSKSDEYAQLDELYEGVQCLLLCRVTLGEILTLQQGGKNVQNTIQASLTRNGGAFDSVMGDREASVGTFREFVVYNQEHVYPEFAIFYQRR